MEWVDVRYGGYEWPSMILYGSWWEVRWVDTEGEVFRDQETMEQHSEILRTIGIGIGM